jgi:NAD(P)H-nitrite reductase large subunit
MSNDVIICRCNDLTRDDIISAIEDGYQTLEELKRHLRVGMGPCQGRTCLPLVAQILVKRTGKSLDEVKMPTSRPPLEPTPLYVFTGGSHDKE